MQKKETYDKILQMFCATTTAENRRWLLRPFRIENTVMASDSKSVVILNDYPDMGSIEETPVSNIGRVKRFMHPNTNNNLIFPVESLRNVFSELTFFDVEKEISPAVECEACSGTGWVDAYFDFNGKSYSGVNAECPLCDCSGFTQNARYENTGLVAPSDWYLKIQFGRYFISVSLIWNMIEAARLIDASSVELISVPEQNHDPLYFLVKGTSSSILIALMPMAYDYGDMDDETKAEVIKIFEI